MLSETVSGIADHLSQIGSGSIITMVNISFAAVSATAAVISARAARHSVSRQRPVVDVAVRKNEPWQGWCVVSLTVRNPAPSAMHIEMIRVGRIDCARIEMLQRLNVKKKPHVERNFVTGETSFSMRMTVPDDPPVNATHRKVEDLAIDIPTAADRPKRIDIACAPGNAGAICMPKALILHYRWLDRRQRKMVHRAHI